MIDLDKNKTIKALHKSQIGCTIIIPVIPNKRGSIVTKGQYTIPCLNTEVINDNLPFPNAWKL